MQRVLALFVLATSLLLGACANTEIRSRENILDATLRSYGAAIRWGNIEDAQSFLEPDYRAAHPLSQLERERYQQIQVSGYDAQPPSIVNDNEVHQMVRIELVNVHSQRVRTIVDRQVWKYEPEKKHWWLTTGLPDISRKGSDE